MAQLSRDLRTVPNVLTLTRIGLLVVAAVIYFYVSRVTGIVLAVVAGVTDYADGAIARATGQVTRLGEILDQFSDLVFESIAMIVAVFSGIFSPLYLVAYLLRELWVMSVRRFMAGHGLNISSSWLGKAKTNVLMWSFLPTFLSASEVWPGAHASLATAGRVLAAIGLAMGWASGWSYTRQFARGYDEVAARGKTPIG
jgi:CDP-diacylglycerol--glycerol-3-phosphate 3-phosphatidyltransferase